MPLISVVMPVFNCRKYLAESIESILNQTFVDFEFIIVDDGSTDGSSRIIEQYAKTDDRINVHFKLNGGIVSALNLGVSVAKCDLLARMDGDDICHPQRFEAQVAYLNEHPEICLLGTATEYADSAGRRLKSNIPPQRHDDILKQLLVGDGAAMIHPTLMGPTSTWRDVGGYRPEFNYVEDYDLYLRASKLGKLANLNVPFLRNRLHSNSTNHTRAKEQYRLTSRLCQDFRNECGATNEFILSLNEDYETTASFHRQWAYWAVEGNEMNTALKHSLLSLLKNPLSKKSRNCFGYVFLKWCRQNNHPESL